MAILLLYIRQKSEISQILLVTDWLVEKTAILHLLVQLNVWAAFDNSQNHGRTTPMTKLPVFSVEGQVKQQSVPPSLDPPQSEGTNPNRGSNLNIGCIL